MAEYLITVQYRDAAGDVKYHSTEINDVDPKFLKESIQDAADTMTDDGMTVEVSKGHYMFVPAHAIYRADFQVINEQNASEKP
ncbi:hypothetical protein [Streptomyces sp. NPDC057363]|uniref:hypothetical protein n=1 Tax=Streptomyces sp. NPDC057363 TaxID=3346107 RepID=UPI0036453749